MPVVVVSDSSSRLQPDELKQWDIREVPLHVLVDGIDLRDGVDDIPYDIHDRPQVTTAGATPAELVETYRQALAGQWRRRRGRGASLGRVVEHVQLGGAAAREFGPSVRVVNSRSAAMGVGFVALAAAQLRGLGRRPRRR